MRIRSTFGVLLAAALAAGCGDSQPADTAPAQAPAAAPAQVSVTPEMEAKTVEVTPVSPDGKAAGEPQQIQVAPEMNPEEMGLTPVPAAP